MLYLGLAHLLVRRSVPGRAAAAAVGELKEDVRVGLLLLRAVFCALGKRRITWAPLVVGVPGCLGPPAARTTTNSARTGRTDSRWLMPATAARYDSAAPPERAGAVPVLEGSGDDVPRVLGDVPAGRGVADLALVASSSRASAST